MRVQPTRALVAVIALAEVGAAVGALVCWFFLVGWCLAWHAPASWPAGLLLGLTLFALMFGVPLGAVLTPLLTLTLLRRVPLRYALGLPLAGAILGGAVAALMAPGPTWPLPPQLLILITAGLILGSIVARRWTARPARSPAGVVPRAAS